MLKTLRNILIISISYEHTEAWSKQVTCPNVYKVNSQDLNPSTLAVGSTLHTGDHTCTQWFSILAGHQTLTGEFKNTGTCTSHFTKSESLDIGPRHLNVKKKKKKKVPTSVSGVQRGPMPTLLLCGTWCYQTWS